MSNFQNLINKITQGYAVLELVDSEINGQIEIREDIFRKRTMVAGGLAQSGKEVEKIWSKVIQQFSNLPADAKASAFAGGCNNLTINNCLILGLGAGTVAQLISKKYPNIKMTGIEIDPEIIELGKKYFELEDSKNLIIVVADAISYISNGTTRLDSAVKPRRMKQSSIYDLILVDLYLGNQYPKEAGSSEFLISLKKLLTEDGHIIFNRLYYHESDKQQADDFGKKLRNAFNQVDEKEIGWNKFFFVR